MMTTMNTLRKTHPMVLIAAVALTIFSLLGSAAITGIIPSARPEKQDVVQNLTDATGRAISKGKTIDSAQDSEKRASEKNLVCPSCGTIVSIRAIQHGDQVSSDSLMTGLALGGGAYADHAIEQKMKNNTAYIIKLRMNNGSYRTVTQYKHPPYSIGDQVRLRSELFTSA